ncbi:uncharacterized protein PAC_01513 [Phialocephala subalpina]|uniref:DUF6594 domain-containing protein n=1 Tax=Phialocephala subalpina TaxID=576137 RepID=A0A1L7WFT7_9HELO|nr:uncharacterized protein PAC_01513 [Phialocephala subalpina]
MAQRRRDAVGMGYTLPPLPDTYAEDHSSAERADPPAPSQRMNSQIRNRGAGSRHGPAEGEEVSTPAGTISSEATQVKGQPETLSATTKQTGSGFTLQTASAQTGTQDQASPRDHGFNRMIYEDVDRYPKGWPRLAAFINSSDHNAVFRRFGRLSARLLLQLQVDLTDLEKELDDLDNKDAGNTDVEPRLRGYEKFPADDGAQREILGKIQKKICEYFEVLTYESQVRALTKAQARHHLGLFTWMRNRKPLGDKRDDFIFHVEDFISVAKQSEKGTRIADLIESLVTWWPNRVEKYVLQTDRERVRIQDPYVDQYSEARVGLLTRIIAVFLAVCILLIPVMLLFLVDMSKQAMAWLVFVFVLAFCGMISVMTEAKVQDIFIATAAYAAVLVTFLGKWEKPKKQDQQMLFSCRWMAMWKEVS